ncbi:MAG: polymer-forming cytoskeletal protein [Ignavibacteria bacterium]|nr:polymer-forming cytoskeletal protein [Ignavibacteria bacterium]MBT8381115.1 polymer-forming cytoskeletal protein [Ignavibacteria bacterium]MBT8392151.1 polymer-forming cytoskeletal protein [Ignavibacteria bacterium]NNJ53551.1 polymer-forming cytoskeletal protein [Ignavibacteriaceae bacterium]NNL21423.1 polymer-forming cytoskeletal protein [Ignavibacteriaceae bacterium]
MLKSTSTEETKTDETTIIGRGVKIDGKLNCDGNIRVEGEIKGDILSKSSVIIGEKGNVNGQINADIITIGGKVSGTVKANKKILLDTTGNLEGDIFTKILVVEEGAKFEGNSKMGDSG